MRVASNGRRAARVRNAGRGERAAAPSQAVSMAKRVGQLNSGWRDGYNPMRGMTIHRAIGLFEAAQRGDLTEIQWVYGAPQTGIEVSNPTLGALIDRRTGALQEMDADIVIATAANGQPLKPDEQRLAEDQAGALRVALERLTNLYEAIEHLEMAVFRGYAHLQPQNSNGDVTLDAEVLLCLDQWNFVRDGFRGPWYWNQEARPVNYRTLGDEARIDPVRDYMIVREVRRFVNRIALVDAIRRALCEKDWDAFIEIFGIPNWIIIGPPSMSVAERAAFLAAAEKLQEGSPGALPHGSEAKTPEGVRGSQPFKERLGYLNEQLVLAATGGLLTVLAQSGSGTLAGSAHMEAFKTLARKSARMVSECLQKFFFDRILDRDFPGQRHLAYFVLDAKEEKDLGKIAEQTQQWASAGYYRDAAQLSEETGIKFTFEKPQSQPGGLLPKPTVRALNSKSPGADPEELGDYLAKARLEIAAAEHEALETVATKLIEIYRTSESEDWPAERVIKELQALRNRLPDLLLEMGESQDTADAIARALAPAFAEGLAQYQAKEGA